MNGQVMLQQEFQYSGSLQVGLGEYDAGIYLKKLSVMAHTFVIEW